jgi:hypothetical protein
MTAGQNIPNFGRLPRQHDPLVPHLSRLPVPPAPAPPPDAVDWTKALPAELGAMLNDTLGNCTCAAFYHALQVWTGNTGTIDTVPDAAVRELYIEACGYDPTQPGNGPGGDAQSVLKYVLNHGAPIGPDGQGRHKIAGFVEIDPRNLDDVKCAINECGGVYVGFNVPKSFVPCPTVWQAAPGPEPIIGSHAVFLAGYDAAGARAISWGQYYTMSWGFFGLYVDEVYAIADRDWTNIKRTTPCGLTLGQLEAEMRALRERPPHR